MLSRQALLSATRAAAPARSTVPRAVFASSQLRTYATPAQADSKPPVALYGLDGTYASALVCRFRYSLTGDVGEGDEDTQLDACDRGLEHQKIRDNWSIGNAQLTTSSTPQQ
jgi:hypothetical protein